MCLCCSPGHRRLHGSVSELVRGRPGPGLRLHREESVRFKQTVDRLELSSVRVLTSPQGRDTLLQYQQLLFTAVYTFDYQVRSVDDVTCPSCSGSAHTDSPAEGVQEEVSAFLQQLPALRGDVTVLTSTMIPDCFGHGFSSRPGGVSYISTLSSMNLFSSSRRRDPGPW
ncbi:hypothetical protein INR49_011600 [Caranx melampygus]|nr:hypothetical protein INR49_011600 [Caranx melampygus]